MKPLLDIARAQYLDCNVGAAISTLDTLTGQSQSDALLLQHIAEMYVQCSQHEKAGRCYSRSVELEPSNPDFLYNLAASKTALGELGEAERIFTQVIRIRPDDYGAWLNRSGLHKQTAESNHVDQLRFVRSQLGKDDPGRVQVCYALAKELEDIGQYEESFTLLQEGSHLRRQAMQYDVAVDESAMAAIAHSFNKNQPAELSAIKATERPVFILGLPRSGTTLIDRIVSSHSEVGSLGEHNTLPLALMRLSGANPKAGVGEAGGKANLIEKASRIDHAKLGQRYLQGIDGFGNSAQRLVDKTPLNFLYLGLIRLALPGAKIIHLRRNPMDSCYAIYKTLFRAGYPFSYSLQETGRYYIAYRRLMDHWRQTFPGSFLDVEYETVVGGQEQESRRILDYLELEWEEGCLQFHRHQGPAATASAAQVRQPIYSSSVGLWRNYARQLAPFAGKLREAGIDID